MKWRLGKPAIGFVVIVMAAVLVVPVTAQNRRGRNRPITDLPKGPERQVILDSCTTCHGIDDYAYYAMDRDGWQKLVGTMKEKGAVIPDDKESILLDWLVTKFGPDSKPFPRTRGGGAVLNFGGGDEAAKDAASQAILDTVCTTCHSLERNLAAKRTQVQWRDIIATMKTRGAQLDDAAIAPLADYLAKAYGN